jgi:hypothetical protein
MKALRDAERRRVILHVTRVVELDPTIAECDPTIITVVRVVREVGQQPVCAVGYLMPRPTASPYTVGVVRSVR